MKRTFMIACLALSACGDAQERPEPIVQVREVKVEVVKPCPALAAVGPAPAYPDTDAALRVAPNLFERVRLLMAGRLQRIAREIALTGALNACD